MIFFAGRELGFNTKATSSSNKDDLFAYKAVDGRHLESSENSKGNISSTCFSTRLWGEQKAFLAVHLKVPMAIRQLTFHGLFQDLGMFVVCLNQKVVFLWIFS